MPFVFVFPCIFVLLAQCYMIMETPQFDFEAGEVLLIDKPLEWTSFDAVKKIRNLSQCKKVGHAGTLDPLATGLLIICTGKKTKAINLYQDAEKEYVGELVIGATTPSIDLETAVENQVSIEHITLEQVKAATQQFLGEIQQIPPLYSAINIDGKRAYELARKGVEKKLEARTVTIKEFELTNIALPTVLFRVVCSKGTYIRSLVRDFGQVLGVGAYMSALRRTRIGDQHINNAWKLEELTTILKARKAALQ